uniref:Hexosyltransferase n=1 Tax=Trichobilharzia regenti TaxID=157069 RepID=A0AA85JRC3_TRIRE|nr:unnamed protein product [Trichobilharzia regenti]
MQFHIISFLFRFVIHCLHVRHTRLLCTIVLFISFIFCIWLFITLCLQEDYQIFHFPPNLDLYKIHEKEKLKVNPSAPPLWRIIFPLSSNYKDMCFSRNRECNRNNHNSSFHQSPCQTADLFLIIRSHVSHFNQRDAIRQTWGNQQCYENFGAYVRILFILGRENDYGNNDPVENIINDKYYENDQSNSVLSKLYYEHSTHHDIIQFDFFDDCSNLQNKWIGSMDFLAKYCSANSKSFVILLDEDYFLHPVNLINLLHRVTPSQYRIYASGDLRRVSYPVRVPFLPGYISLSDYPFNIYPPYLFGGTIILSMPVVQLLRTGFLYVKSIPYDDIMLGIILLKFGVGPVHNKQIYSHYPPDMHILKKLQFITVHGFNKPSLLHSLWSTLNMDHICKIKMRE